MVLGKSLMEVSIFLKCQLTEFDNFFHSSVNLATIFRSIILIFLHNFIVLFFQLVHVTTNINCILLSSQCYALSVLNTFFIHFIKVVHIFQKSFDVFSKWLFFFKSIVDFVQGLIDLNRFVCIFLSNCSRNSWALA